MSKKSHIQRLRYRTVHLLLSSHMTHTSSPGPATSLTARSQWRSPVRVKSVFIDWSSSVSVTLKLLICTFLQHLYWEVYSQWKWLYFPKTLKYVVYNSISYIVNSNYCILLTYSRLKISLPDMKNNPKNNC